jgi:adenylate kinase family enzyme
MKNHKTTGKFFITGRQGSGKTTVGRELRKQSFAVFDIDHTEGLAKLRQLSTGQLFDFSEIASRSPDGLIDWDNYWFEVQKNSLREILASDDLVFITGSASNSTEFFDMFDKVFVLIVDPETAKSRLINHEHASHHLPSEIERILENFNEKQAELVAACSNTVSIDGRKSLPEIVEAIQAQIVKK